MIRFARALGFAALLTLGLVLATGQNPARAFADDKEAIKEAQKELVDLAKAIADGKDGKDLAAAMKKKYEDLGPIMHIYKPSPKGGIGIGKKAAGDGMELKIINLGKRISAADAAKEKDDIIKIGHLNVAIAEVTALYAPAKPKGGKGAKDWKQHCEDQKKASLDLVAAAKAGTAAKIKAAANNLNNACNNCHSDFRD